MKNAAAVLLLLCLVASVTVCIGIASKDYSIMVCPDTYAQVNFTHQFDNLTFYQYNKTFEMLNGDSETDTFTLANTSNSNETILIFIHINSDQFNADDADWEKRAINTMSLFNTTANRSASRIISGLDAGIATDDINTTLAVVRLDGLDTLIIAINSNWDESTAKFFKSIEIYNPISVEAINSKYHSAKTSITFVPGDSSPADIHDLIRYYPYGDITRELIESEVLYYVKESETMWPGGPRAPFAGYITKVRGNNITDQEAGQIIGSANTSYLDSHKDEIVEVGSSVFRDVDTGLIIYKTINGTYVGEGISYLAPVKDEWIEEVVRV